MSDIASSIREEARKILGDGTVNLVIGYGAGSVPFKTTPVFIEKPEDADRLVWNPACVNNLAVYLPRVAKDRKVGIIAKPCDVRSIVTLIQEKQIKRENVYIIGLGCEGVIDAATLSNVEGLSNAEGRSSDPAVLSSVEGRLMQDVTAMEWTGSDLRVTAGTAECTLPRAECLREACLVCTKREPAMSDVTYGQEAPADEAPASTIPELPEERQKYWAEQFSRCIRCYACRQVCPNCYCEQCFADRIEPKWTAKKATTEEAWMFHATRAMHIAGRCIGCGECERVCPVGIPMNQLMREMCDAVKDKYGYEAGDPNEEAPALGQYKEGDIDPAHHGG